jgi:hypothetical protein
MIPASDAERVFRSIDILTRDAQVRGMDDLAAVYFVSWNRRLSELLQIPMVRGNLFARKE